MYEQLDENLNTSSSVDRSIQVNRDERRSGGSIISSTKMNVFKSSKRNSSSELRQSLMDDDDSVIDSISLSHSLQQDHGSTRSYTSHNTSAIQRPVVDDPFHVFQQDLMMKFDLAEGSLEQLQHIVRTTDTAVNGHQVKETKKLLKRHIKNVDLALGDLQSTVKMVEKKRDEFPNIDKVELENRKDFIRLSAERIASIKTTMNSQDIKTKMLADEESKRIRRSGGGVAPSGSFNIRSGTDIEEAQFLGVQGQYATTKLMMQQQEETLDDLDSAVVRVSHIASNIHDELGHQNRMMKELEDDLQNAEEELGMVMGKLGKILKTKNKWQLGTIMMLSLIAVILFFLVLYT